MLAQTPHFHAPHIAILLFKYEIDVAVYCLGKNTVIEPSVHFPISIARNLNMHILIFALERTCQHLSALELLWLTPLIE